MIPLTRRLAALALLGLMTFSVVLEAAEPCAMGAGREPEHGVSQPAGAAETGVVPHGHAGHAPSTSQRAATSRSDVASADPAQSLGVTVQRDEGTPERMPGPRRCECVWTPSTCRGASCSTPTLAVAPGTRTSLVRGPGDCWGALVIDPSSFVTPPESPPPRV